MKADCYGRLLAYLTYGCFDRGVLTAATYRTRRQDGNADGNQSDTVSQRYTVLQCTDFPANKGSCGSGSSAIFQCSLNGLLHMVGCSCQHRCLTASVRFGPMSVAPLVDDAACSEATVGQRNQGSSVSCTVCHGGSSDDGSGSEHSALGHHHDAVLDDEAFILPVCLLCAHNKFCRRNNDLKHTGMSFRRRSTARHIACEI